MFQGDTDLQYQTLLDKHELLILMLDDYHQHKSAHNDKEHEHQLLVRLKCALHGAEELLLRWDETNTDFAIAIEIILANVEQQFGQHTQNHRDS